MYDGGSAAPEGDEDYEGFSLEKYQRYWREYVDECAEARRQSFIDQEYYDGDVTGTGLGHWTRDELGVLAQRRQPPSVFNAIRRIINAISGVEQRARSEPRAYPRTPKDQRASEIGTDVLRFVKEQSRWSMIKADRFLEALKCGTAVVEIGYAPDSVPVTPIEWADFFYDPRSRRADFSDARFLGIAKWVDCDVAEVLYAPDVPAPQMPAPPQIPPPPSDPYLYAQWEPLAQRAQIMYEQEVARARAEYEKAVAERERIVGIIHGTMASGTLADGATFEDLPAEGFGDITRRRVFAVDMWHRDPKTGWFRCVFTGGGKLFTEKATLKDEKGRPTHPIVAFSIYVSRKLWRHGIIRDLRPVQDEINKRRSKALHLLTTNQIVMEEGASTDGNDERLRAEAAKPDGVMLVRPNARFELLKNIDLAQGQKAMGDEAHQYIEQMAPNPQLQGQQGQASSGRAILALQEAGKGQLGPAFDRLNDWELRVYRTMWARVKQFWKAEMFVRVTDDEGAAKFIGVNGAPTPPDPRKQAQRPPQMPPQAMPPGMQPPNPMMGNNGGPPMTPEDMGEPGPMLSELDLDIILDRAPEAATLQAEQFEQIAKLASTGAINLPPEAILEASSLPNKSAIMDKMKAAQDGAQGPNPAQEAEMQMVKGQIAELLASIEKIKSETRENNAQAAKLEAETRSVQADTTLQGIERTSALMQPQVPSAPPAAMGDFRPPL